MPDSPPRVAIVAGARTPFAKAGTKLKGHSALDLARHFVDGLLDKHAPWIFNHHLGHGVGLFPHEGPHLNPHWDDTFEEGDFFTAEPGLYHEDLRHGIRLEENYVVTPVGVEKLTDYPLELVC